MRKKLPIVHVKFLDHVYASGGESDPIPCEVFGLLYKKTKKAFYICSWVAPDSPGNNDVYTLLRSTVTSVRRLGSWVKPE